MKRYLTWVIILAGALVRLALINQPGWYDEYFTLLVVGSPSRLAAVLGDVHPPLYYWLAGSLQTLGELRVFSLLLGVAVLVAAWDFTHALGLPWPVRITALVLLAACPVELIYSVEGRMYTLLGWLVLLQATALVNKQWVRLGVFTLLALYTHNYAIFYSLLLGVAGLLALLLEVRPARRGQIDHMFFGQRIALLSLGLPWLVFAPWLVVLLGQMGQIAGVYWIPEVTAGAVVSSLVAAWLGPVPDGWQLVAIGSLAAVLGLLVSSGVHNRRWLLLLLGLGPVALAVLGSIIWQPVLLFRGFTPSLPFLAVLAGESFTQAKGPARLGRWLLLLPWLVALGYMFSGQYQRWWVSWPEPAPTAGMVVHMEDTSMVTALGAGWPGSHYLLDAGCPEQRGALSNQTRAALGMQTIGRAELPAQYTLAAVIGPLSTACHEEIFNQLTAPARVVYQGSIHFGRWGIYSIGDK
jgi:uncharacterized membrane protein